MELSGRQVAMRSYGAFRQAGSYAIRCRQRGRKPCTLMQAGMQQLCTLMQAARLQICTLIKAVREAATPFLCRLVGMYSDICIYSYVGRYGGIYALLYRQVGRRICTLTQVGGDAVMHLCRQVLRQLYTPMQAGSYVLLWGQLCILLQAGSQADMHSYVGRQSGKYALLCRQVVRQICTLMQAGKEAAMHSYVGRYGDYALFNRQIRRQLCNLNEAGMEPKGGR